MNQKLQNQSGEPAPAGKIQGEGDYEASRRYREEVGEFLDKADVAKLAKESAPKTAQEAREMALAQESGARRSKGDDPADVKAMYPGQNSGS
jgi:hypothetical protein